MPRGVATRTLDRGLMNGRMDLEHFTVDSTGQPSLRSAHHERQEAQRDSDSLRGCRRRRAARRRVQRRLRLTARLRVLGQAGHDRSRAAANGRHLRRAHEAARIHPIRRPCRGHRSLDRRLDGDRGRTARGRPAPGSLLRQPPNPAQPDVGLTPEEIRLKAIDSFPADERGYQAIQGTKPQTLGYDLNDSPAGLAAWIVEKYRAWCDCNGDPEFVFMKDELLPLRTRVTVPTACMAFPREVLPFVPRSWAKQTYNVQRFTFMPRGGYFTSLEQRHSSSTTSGRSSRLCGERGVRLSATPRTARVMTRSESSIAWSRM